MENNRRTSTYTARSVRHQRIGHTHTHTFCATLDREANNKSQTITEFMLDLVILCRIELEKSTAMRSAEVWIN